MRFLLEILAAFFFWALKGFKGKLSDEISGSDDRHSKKAIRNSIISMILVYLIYLFSLVIGEDNKWEIIKKELESLYKVQKETSLNIKKDKE